MSSKGQQNQVQRAAEQYWTSVANQARTPQRTAGETQDQIAGARSGVKPAASDDQDGVARRRAQKMSA